MGSVTTYATWNPSDKGSNMTLSGGNLSGSTSSASVRSTIGVSNGKWYWESKFTGSSANGCVSGVADASMGITANYAPDTHGWGYATFVGGGYKWNNGGGSGFGAAYAPGDIIGCALDMDNGTFKVYKNNVLQGTLITGLTGTWYAGAGSIASNAVTFTTNFGATALTYTPPTGYNAGLYIVTTTQTETGVANILVPPTTKTITGKSRITAVTSKTETGVANIKATTTRTITGVSRITNSTLKTETGVSRITVSTSKTITGVSRITAKTSKTESGVARITGTTLKTETGVARVTNSTTKTETGVARITNSTTKTETGVARVTASTRQTETGVARITATTLKTETGISRITATTLKTETGVGRIQVSSTQTITGVSRITGSTGRTETGKARITASTTKTETGIARVTRTTTKTETGQARIFNPYGTARDILGVANIKNTTNQTITGVANIVPQPKQGTYPVILPNSADRIILTNEDIVSLLNTPTEIIVLSTGATVSTLTTQNKSRIVL